GGVADPVLADGAAHLPGGGADDRSEAVRPAGRHVRPFLRPALRPRDLHPGRRGVGPDGSGAAVRARIDGQAQAVLLFLLGATVLHTGLTDLHLRYVTAGLRPLLLLSGAVLIATAAATVRYEWRRPPRSGEAHREPRIAWLLTLPLLALILIAPPALGSYSATHTGTALQKPLGFPELPVRGPLRLSAGE